MWGPLNLHADRLAHLKAAGLSTRVRAFGAMLRPPLHPVGLFQRFQVAVARAPASLEAFHQEGVC